ncbi:cell division protein ZapE [soil metagenome]
MLSPIYHYQQYIQQHGFTADPLQDQVIQQLQLVYENVLQRQQQNRAWSLVRDLLLDKQPSVKGLYLWGGVGIGKTWLMDIFYECLPGKKLRIHFHQFMRSVHVELKRLQGKSDPLKLVAKQFASTASVICFDEFFVSDIADAMLLAGLLQALFAQGVCLVTTSNVAPENLYRSGIGRDRFLPAIALLQQHTEIVHMASLKDYRLRELHHAKVYFSPLNATAAQHLQVHFNHLSEGHEINNEPLQVEGRKIPVVWRGEGVVWFDFSVLCNVPRSQVDYLDIAQNFHTVIVATVPCIPGQQTNIAHYLINLVDVFYDAHVRLIISAACPIDEIYVSGGLAFEFERTKSRLYEMQSREYLDESQHVIPAF